MLTNRYLRTKDSMSLKILMIILTLMLILFVLIKLLPALERNQRSLAFVFAAEPNAVVEGDDAFKTNFLQFLDREENDCYKLWQSKEAVLHSLEEAKRILASISACMRRDQIDYLAGELAWKLGDTRQAQESWSMLNDNQLAGIIISNSRSGETDIGKFLIELFVINGRDRNLSPGLKVEMYSQAAEMARLKGNNTDAVGYFYLAWEASGQDYLQSYYLGKLYFDLGRYEDAIQILEIGLDDRIVLNSFADFRKIFHRTIQGRKTFGSMDKILNALNVIGSGEIYYLYPELDFSYFAALIDSSNRLNDKDRSWKYIMEAERIITDTMNSTSQDAIGNQRERLDRMISEARMIE